MYVDECLHACENNPVWQAHTVQRRKRSFASDRHSVMPSPSAQISLSFHPLPVSTTLPTLFPLCHPNHAPEHPHHQPQPTTQSFLPPPPPHTHHHHHHHHTPHSMTRGNQRERDRAKAQKAAQGQKKATGVLPPLPPHPPTIRKERLTRSGSRNPVRKCSATRIKLRRSCGRSSSEVGFRSTPQGGEREKGGVTRD